VAENQSQHELLMLIQNGDRTALGDLYIKIRRRLFVYLLKRFSRLTKKDIEDAIQNTFIKIPLYAHQYRGINAQGWIYSIARREALRMVEAFGRTPRSLDNDTLTDSSAVPEGDPLLIDPAWAGEDSVEDRIISLSDKKAMQNAFEENLNLKEQKVLHHRYDEEDTFEEIGRDLGRSKVRAKQIHDSAISKLRSLLRLD